MKIAVGQQHSCFIGKMTNAAKPKKDFRDRLYVWGNNTDNVLFSQDNHAQKNKTNKNGANSNLLDNENGFDQVKIDAEKQEAAESDSNIVHWPSEICLKYKGLEYDAISVCCGSTYTLVLGYLPIETINDTHGVDSKLFKNSNAN